MNLLPFAIRATMPVARHTLPQRVDFKMAVFCVVRLVSNPFENNAAANDLFRESLGGKAIMEEMRH